MQSDNARGAFMMMGSMAAFVLNDTMMKLVSGEMPLFQAILLRGLMTTAVFLVFAWRGRALWIALQGRDRVLIGLRVFAEAASTWFFLTALTNMPLANLTAILQALPLTLTLAAALLFGEAIGWRRLLAIGIGFVGVLLIVRPSTEGFDQYAVYALASVFFVTMRDLVTRRMAAAVPSMTVAFYSALGVTVFAGVGAMTVDWVTPAPMSGLYLLVAAGFIVVGYLLSITAMRVGELGFVTPFRYTGLVWALVLGFTVFGDWPDPVTLAGAALIVSTGLFTLYRESMVVRRARRAAQSMPR